MEIVDVFYESPLIYSTGKNISVRSMWIRTTSILMLALCIGALLSTMENVAAEDDDEALLSESDFSISIEPPILEGEPGSSVVYSVKISTIDGLEGKVELSIEGLPTGAVEAFYPEMVRLDLELTSGLRSILMITTDPSTPYGTYNFTVIGTLGVESSAANATLHIVEEAMAFEEDFIIEARPSTESVKHAGEMVSYTVEVKPLGDFDEKVSLSVSGLPDGSVALFNPREGRVDHQLTSKLTIITAITSPPGIYELLIFGAYKDLTHYTTVQLIIEEAVTTTTTTTQMVRKRLQVTTSTDKPSYLVDETVSIFGYVHTFKGESLPDASITIQVLDPSGNSKHMASVTSDRSGYSENFILAADSQPGTYSIYITASHVDHLNGYSSSVFTVGKSLTPSVTIESLYTTTVDGSIQNSFSPGETVIVWVSAVNGGADLRKGMIWVEVVDPKGVPVMVGILITTIREGRGVKTGLQVVLDEDSIPGIYKASGFISDDLISKGGRFLASKQIFFIVS